MRSVSYEKALYNTCSKIVTVRTKLITLSHITTITNIFVIFFERVKWTFCPRKQADKKWIRMVQNNWWQWDKSACIVMLGLINQNHRIALKLFKLYILNKNYNKYGY